MNLSADPSARTGELAAAAVRADLAAALGTGAPVLVEGPSGSGVSWLLDATAVALRQDGIGVRRLRMTGRTAAGVLGRLRTALEPGPAVVVVDDLHRIHPEAVAELADELRDPTPGVAVLLGGRSGRVPQALRSAAGGHQHVLPAWGLGDVRAAYPTLGRARAEQLLEAADGRPAYVRALAGMGLLELRELHRLPVDAVAERVDLCAFRGWAAEAFAAEPTRVVAATAALLGDTVDLDAVADVADLSTAAAAHAAVLVLVEEGVLVVRESRIAFDHPVLKAFCYTQVDPARRQELHRRAAERARDPRWPGMVPRAAHLCVAGAVGDLEVVQTLVAAARECLASAPSTAARWSRCAVGLCPNPDAPPAVTARAVLGEALAAQGRVLAAAEVAKELLAVPSARRTATILAARCERALGHDSVAAALIRAEVADGTLGELPAELLVEAAVAGVATLGSPASPDGGPGCGHLVAVQIVEVVRAETRGVDRQHILGRIDAAHAAVAALPAGELTRIVEHLAPLALACLRVGRTALAAELVAHGLHVVGARGEVLVDLLNARASVDLRLGRIAAARRRAQSAAEIAAELGLARAARLSAALLTQMDAVTRGSEVTDPAPLLGGSADGDTEVHALHAEAHALLGSGAAEPWWIALLGARGGCQDAAAAGIRARALAAEAAAVGGDPEAARALLGPRPTGGVAVDLAWWSRAQAVLLTHADDLQAARQPPPQAAQEAALEAVTAWSAIGWPMEVSRARLVLAEALRRQGEHRRAEREAGLAKAVLQRLGADAVAQRAVALQKRIAASQSRGLRDGEFGLSAREAEIAQLVCSGRTNREIAGQLFLSVRTVDSHVAKVLTKVGVQTRVALAAMFAGGTAAVA